MRNKIIIALSILTILTACSSKSAFFNENAQEQSIVVNTKKGELYSSLEIKATIVSTYLNKALLEFKDNEHEMFLVSIYIDGDSSDKNKQGFFNKSFPLTLNGKKAILNKLLDYKDDLIKLAPVRNNWSHYYLLGFEKQDGVELKMEFKNLSCGEAVLEFQKEL